GSFNILFVGRLEPRKGAKYLLKALPAILEQVPEARLIVVGGGPMSNYYMNHLPLGCEDRVVFAGRVSGESLARHYATADVFCSPATGGESFGIVLIEAMAAGAAVVASRIAGYSAVARDNVTALLVEPESPEAIAGAVIRLARNDELRRGLIEAAKAEVRQYDWNRVTVRVVDVYRTVLGSGTPESSQSGDASAVVEEARVCRAVD
ncbi:MAG: glycosyltransferase, partial [Candidatus Eisenbacteria bacterium]|nr:glycosyltransferase [Candidatus Eisenbacteria bacterium]